MTRIIMRGCNGRMGQVISDIVSADENAEITAGIDIYTEQKNGYPVFTKLSECDAPADVIIDFASADGIEEFLEDAVNMNLPIVLCTTGLTEEQLIKVEEASERIAILRSANMSLGVNTLLKLVKTAAKVLVAANFDIEIVEKHHNQKLDAPSGTALALADAINEELKNEYCYNYDRSKERKQRERKEIGISAVRGGTIVGEHDIIFAGQDEVIEFRHTAYSKAIFGNGAVQAAKYLGGKSAGMYYMSDVIG